MFNDSRWPIQSQTMFAWESTFNTNETSACISKNSRESFIPKLSPDAVLGATRFALSIISLRHKGRNSCRRAPWNISFGSYLIVDTMCASKEILLQCGHNVHPDPTEGIPEKNPRAGEHHWCFNRHQVPRKAVASAARMSHKPLFKYSKVVISCFCYFETEEAKENIWMCSPEVRAEVWFGLVWIKEKRPRTTHWFTLFQDLAHSLDQVQNPMTLCQKMLRKEQR